MQKKVRKWGDESNRAERLVMLEDTIEAISEGIIITDAEGTIIYYNRALERMEGLRREEVIGRHLMDVYRVTPETSEHLTVVKTGKPFKELAKIHYTAEGGKSAWYPAPIRFIWETK